MKLFHFSDDADIAVFTPRAVRIPVPRAPGRAWLNDPLVWAIDQAHEFMYLFPRECPRILAWARPDSSEADRGQWLGSARVVAYIELDWLDSLSDARLYRYELDPAGFESLDDAGMWVARQSVAVLERAVITDPRHRLEQLGVSLQALPTLAPLQGLRQTSLHASGIRLRNARTWPGHAVEKD